MERDREKDLKVKGAGGDPNRVSNTQVEHPILEWVAREYRRLPRTRRKVEHDPEFFVLNKERKVVYMGAMDDSWTDPKVNYLEPAVEAVLKGQVPRPKETRASSPASKVRR